jgi:putative radical SAM enzyme (TIGR03279 family)
VARAPGGIITAVEPGSLGQVAGLTPGDRLVAINGRGLRDIIDVQFYAAEETLELLVERHGQRIQIAVHRDYEEELGLSFVNPTFDVDIRRCANNCDFCFAKQNAQGMRRSLYIKDDDYRYSFLFGNFVTLTNLTEDDWARLEEQRLSPLYVSVHATDPGLRRRFLGRSNAPNVMDQLLRLANLGIEIHTQVVLVPDLNDGERVARTIADLTSLFRRPVVSVGVVPIGLTKYHRGRCRTYTPDESKVILDQLERWGVENREQRGCGLVYPSDEWYLVAGWEVPPAEAYDGYPQVENGIGMVRQLLDEWAEARAGPPALHPRSATLVCGTLIAPVMNRIVEELGQLTGVDLRLVPVVNQFFGPVTTVSGLLTGADVVAALQDQPLGDVVLLPKAMFTSGYGAGSALPGMSLDDMPIAAISTQLGSQSGAQVEIAGTMSEVLAALQ